MTKPKVLLTASYGPNELAWGEDQYDLLTSRLARGHGPFQMTSHCHYFGLYLIAENISSPTTVLENPHWEDFDRELTQGYDYVGFQLKSLHTKKVARMIKLIREKSPGTKVVVGGYGVSALDTPVPGDKDGDAVYIRDNADHLCREEGVGFMRRILGDEPVDREITQYHMPTAAFALAGLNYQARLPILLVSLGCPNGCDFCNTSAFFKNKKIYVAEPEQVYRYMKAYRKRFNRTHGFALLFDEDFFMNQEYVRELGRLFRSDRKTRDMRYFTFGSMRSLSQFDPEELADCGLGAVWIGVESFMCGHNHPDDRYAKRGGPDIEKLFAGLHTHGIATIGSLVLGFDFHDPDNLKEDIDRFIALKPTFYQISPLTPCPGTPLFDRMTEEGRIKDTYNWEDFNLWSDDVFELNNFEPGEIKKHFDYAHEKIRDELGPPVVQGMEMAMSNYVMLRDSGRRDKSSKRRARMSKMAAKAMHIYNTAIMENHSSEKVRQRCRELDERFHKEIGRGFTLSIVADKYMSAKLARKMEQEKPPVGSDPPPRWTYYHTRDDRVWVKKGRDAKTVPYRNGISISRTGKTWLPSQFQLWRALFSRRGPCYHAAVMGGGAHGSAPRSPFGLCLVTRLGGLERAELIGRAVLAVAGGADAVQVREKGLSGKELYELAKEIGESVSPRALVLVNDRVDVALAIPGVGAHLPGSGMPTRAARELLVPDRVLGRSCHSLDEALAAERDGADYVTFGPVYETESKKPYGPPQGVDKLRAVTEKLSIPVIAIGGITPEVAAEVRRAGAAGIAVISHILDHPEPNNASADLIAAWEGSNTIRNNTETRRHRDTE